MVHARGAAPAEPPTERQHRRKAEVLTQPEPARVRRTSDAVVLKQGDLFLLANEAGDVPWELPHGFGLFYHDCRFLDGYELTVNGQPPIVLSSGAWPGYEASHYLTCPELPDPDGGEPIPKSSLALERRRIIRGSVCHELLTLRNYGRRTAALRLELRFRARFEDLFILKGFVEGPRGKLLPRRRDGALELAYAGRDRVDRSTTVLFRPTPSALDGECASWEWRLEPGDERVLTIALCPAERRHGMRRRPKTRQGDDSTQLRAWLERSERVWLASAADVRASDPLFDRVLRRSLLDLRLLRTQLHGQHFFAAGVPWFVTLFGRDAATVAIQTLPYGPSMARETLRLLARYQADRLDRYRDAEPGKILHELRLGELARLGEIPQSPAYYGTVDATPLFLILLAEYLNWSGDLELADRLRPQVEAALGWMARFADHDGDGYLDYVGRYGEGFVNQGWKDSGNAIVDADGEHVEPPIALCEVQSYAFRAWRQSAVVRRALGDAACADELERRAEEMRSRFERDFWSDELGCYFMARGRGGAPAAVVSSNAGQVLWGGIASPERAASVAERLFQEDMWSGWGIRTLAAGAVAYNPVSYHLGSVWPHDNGLIASGLCRYGQHDAALRILTALFEAAAGASEARLPELFCGYPRRQDEPQPVRYPVACRPQAWAAGAIPHVLWNLLGLRANALAGRLELADPRLPSWLEWLEIGGLRVGEAVLDLRFERADDRGRAEARWKLRSGELDVRVER